MGGDGFVSALRSMKRQYIGFRLPTSESLAGVIRQEAGVVGKSPRRRMMRMVVRMEQSDEREGRQRGSQSVRMFITWVDQLG